jgi:flagellar basal-body rod protein FlgC
MSGLFQAFDVAVTGMNADQTWLDVVAGNVANSNDTSPVNKGTYAQQTAVLTAAPGGFGETGQGVSAGVTVGSNRGVLEYNPQSPLANRQGEVRVANVDLGEQLVQLVSAQGANGANAAVMKQAQSAYQDALQI